MMVKSKGVATMAENTDILKVVQNSPPGFATAGEAIAAAKSIDSRFLDEGGLAGIIGRSVEAVDFDDRSFIWRLSGHKTLVIIANENGNGVSVSIAGAATTQRAGGHRGVVQLSNALGQATACTC
jgi:hypothetical protein